VSRKTPPLPCLTPSRTSRAGNGQALCMSLADIGSQSLSIRRAVSGSVHPRRPQTISGGGRRQLLTRTRLTANPRGASRAILLKMLNGIPGASTRFYRVANSMDPFTASESPRWWISVLQRDPSLRRRKGPVGCHNSRFNLEANNSQSIKA
jgi:hypothetical protein